MEAGSLGDRQRLASPLSNTFGPPQNGMETLVEPVNKQGESYAAIFECSRWHEPPPLHAALAGASALAVPAISFTNALRANARS